MRSHELMLSYLTERGSDSGLGKREPRVIRGGGSGEGGTVVVVVVGGGSSVSKPYVEEVRETMWWVKAAEPPIWENSSSWLSSVEETHPIVTTELLCV